MAYAVYNKNLPTPLTPLHTPPYVLETNNLRNGVCSVCKNKNKIQRRKKREIRAIERR